MSAASNVSGQESFREVCRELADRFSEVSDELRINAQIISSIRDCGAVSPEEAAFLVTMKSKVEQLQDVIGQVLAKAHA